MSFTAIVPIKAGSKRKSRLAPHFAASARKRIADALAAHVLETLAQAGCVDHIIVVSPKQREGPLIEWRADIGRGLNAELEAALAQISGDVAILHADLAMLSVADIEALCEAAHADGAAIAPDRFEQGTNALALKAGRRLPLAFGPDSFRRHIAALGPAHAVICRPGLALDIDTSEDFDAALAVGWRPPSLVD